MDKYNVIDQFDSLEDLELDMRKWINLPFEFRMRSDEECIRQHDCTNITLYNNLKAKFIEDEASLTESATFASMTPEEKVARYERAKQLALSPYIAIISPIGFESDSIEGLDNAYKKYILLNDKDKRISNSYSLALWGMNVPNMYQIMINELRRKQFNSDGVIDGFVVTGYEPEPTNESVFLNLYKEKIDDIANSFQNRKLYKLAGYFDSEECKEPQKREIEKYILKTISDSYSFKDVLPEICPWYTEADMKRMNQDMKLYTSYQEYRNELVEAINYNSHTPKKDDRLYKFGWSPYSDSMSIKEMMYNARIAQDNYFRYNTLTIENWTDNYDFYVEKPESISESTDDTKDYKPIFIINGTGFDYDNMIFGISFTGNFDESFYMIYKNECYKVDGLKSLTPGIRSNFKEIATIYISTEDIELIESSMDNIKQGDLVQYIPKIIHLLLISCVRKEYSVVKKMFYLYIVQMLSNIANKKYNEKLDYMPHVNIIYNGDINNYNYKIGRIASPKLSLKDA